MAGAFTDAKKDRIGRFELAHEGTLFLDEIATVPLLMQSKLLRVVESGAFSQTTQVTLSLLVVLSWLGYAFSLRGKLIFPLRTLTNLVETLRENDYSMRVRGAGKEDALSELVYEVNTLAQFLQDQRFDAVEATALMRKITAEIDIALFGFDQIGQLQLINESGRRLLDRAEGELLGQAASVLGLADCLEGSDRRLLELALPTRTGCCDCGTGSYSTNSNRVSGRMCWSP